MFTHATSWSVSKLFIQIPNSLHISTMLLNAIMPMPTRLSECIMISIQASGGGPPRQVAVRQSVRVILNLLQPLLERTRNKETGSHGHTHYPFV
jgi:hypothetical protein